MSGNEECKIFHFDTCTQVHKKNVENKNCAQVFSGSASVYGDQNRAVI